MKMPSAEVDIDPSLVARMIDAQHPDLAGPLTKVANGWDNMIFRLGEDLCVRLPRRRQAVELIMNEQRWLPVIAEQVKVRVPVPVRLGVPTDDYPWPWSINPWFEGRTVADIAVGERSSIAVELAEFMAELHQPAPPDAPFNPVRGVPLPSRSSTVRTNLGSGAIPDAERLGDLWDRLVDTSPWTKPAVWVHGDPHPANFLLAGGAAEPRIAAVLDFGDLSGGDPACDLAAAWMFFDSEARAAFQDHHTRLTGLDRDTWVRACGWALGMGTALAAHSDDNPRLAAIGRHVLGQVLLED